MRLDRTDVANLRAAGLTVVELPGWLTNGRPGAHDPKGILCHHTAARQDGLAYAQWMADVGRADLPAPLSQIGLGRDGTVYMQAAGRANHAGRCKPVRDWLKAYPGKAYGDGNAQMIGIEAMNTGSEGWGEVQETAYVTLCAVLAQRRGWDEEHVLGHKETSLDGKPDPTFDMNGHRAQVAARLNHQEDPMANFTEQDLRDSAGEGVLAAKVGRTGLTVGVILDRLYASAQLATARDVAQTAAITALASSNGADPEVIKTAVADALSDYKLTLTKES